MTPPQKARTIEESIEAMAESISRHTVSFKAAKACLGSLVWQARAEGFGEGVDFSAKNTGIAVETIYRDGYEKGFAHAREMAAKIADSEHDRVSQVIRALECPKEAK